jgi:hypothetical protein
MYGSCHSHAGSEYRLKWTFIGLIYPIWIWMLLLEQLGFAISNKLLRNLDICLILVAERKLSTLKCLDPHSNYLPVKKYAQLLDFFRQHDSAKKIHYFVLLSIRYSR